MDTTEQPRLAEPVLRARIATTWPEAYALPLSLLGQILRFMAAVVISVVVFKVSGQAEHPLTAMRPGPYVTFVSITVPAVAAVVAAFALYRPWHALLVVLALTPFWDAAYIGWYVGPVQVILQTIFVLTIAVGAFTPSIARLANSAYAAYNGTGIGRTTRTAVTSPRQMGFAAWRKWQSSDSWESRSSPQLPRTISLSAPRISSTASSSRSPSLPLSST